VRFSEKEYARFCFAFEKAVTDEILRHDPATTVVLSNDVSEGPDFRRLAAGGFRVHTIYHVDVVAYVSAIHLRSLVKPETLVRWSGRVEWLLSGIPRLIFRKQRASLECSRGLIVPSDGMRELLLRCYPETPAVRVVFPGYVAGRRKQAFFRLADLYGSPSRHESYGLTLLEALRAGPARSVAAAAGGR
jgi:hypothetical protein